MEEKYMISRSWIGVALLTAVTVGSWAFYEAKLRDQLSEKIKVSSVLVDSLKKENEQQKVQIANLTSALHQAQEQIHAQQSAGEHEVQDLKKQIEHETSLLQNLRQKIADLQEELQNGDAGLATRIQEQKSLINDLQSRIKKSEAAQKEVSQVSGEIVKNNKDQTQYHMTTLNSQIKDQESLVKQVQAQLNFWRKRRGDINQSAKVEEYQQQLSNQQQVLLQLKAQKVNLSQTNQGQTLDIRQQADQEKQDIKASENQLQDQLQRTQKDLKDLQDFQNNEQKSKNDLKNRFTQAKTEYASEYSKYQMLVESLKKKQGTQ
jgi:chromosome segregation ATPase